MPTQQREEFASAESALDGNFRFDVLRGTLPEQHRLGHSLFPIVL